MRQGLLIRLRDAVRVAVWGLPELPPVTVTYTSDNGRIAVGIEYAGKVSGDIQGEEYCSYDGTFTMLLNYEPCGT